MNYNRGLALVDQLDKVVSIGPNRWKACCPAHADKSPSLSIRQLEDGRVLLHCFAGCSAEEVVGSVGFDMQDLFPDTEKNYRSNVPKQAQRSMDHWVLEIAKADRLKGIKASQKDRVRELEAFKRLRVAK